MSRQNCPHCGVSVVVNADNSCPSCQQELAPNPYSSPAEAADENQPGMGIGAAIYNAFVLVFAGFLLLVVAMFHFVIIPGTDDPGIFYFLVTIYWLLFAGFTVTAAINFYQRKLVVAPTVIQCVLLSMIVWGIPLAILGRRNALESVAQANLSAQHIVKTRRSGGKRSAVWALTTVGSSAHGTGAGGQAANPRIERSRNTRRPGAGSIG